MLNSDSMDAVHSAITAIPENLSEDDFIRRVVEIIRQHFGFYFVGLYTVDHARENAVFRAGTGKLGKAALSRGRKMEVGKHSAIGRAVSYCQIELVDWKQGEVIEYPLPSKDQVDNLTSQTRVPVFEGGPLLPETEWELVLPLHAQCGPVIGVLEIHHSEKVRFGLEQIEQLQSLADQIARRLLRVDNQWTSGLSDTPESEI